MPRRTLYNRYKFLGHLLFWMGSLVLLSLIFNLYTDSFKIHLLLKSLITNLGFCSAVYFNLYILIPKFLKTKNYIFYIFWLIVLLSTVALLIQALFIYPFRYLFSGSQYFQQFDSVLHSAFFFSTFAYVSITSFLKFIKDWLSMQDLNFKLAKIEQQKLEAELKTLKGQLNPHFLFNSLNNIYSLALTKSDHVPDLILKLSDLMRHIIYESKENYIPIEKEIEFVNNFIALQKIRTSDQTKILYRIKGEIPPGKIAPLVFEPFIDNAFKHGLPGVENSDFIRIEFNFQNQGFLDFHVSNNYEETPHFDKRNSGIGVKNVQQRLKYLYPSSEHKLDIKKEENIYSVHLKLKLK